MSASIFTSWLNIVVLAVFFIAAFILGMLLLRTPTLQGADAAQSH